MDVTIGPTHSPPTEILKTLNNHPPNTAPSNPTTMFPTRPNPPPFNRIPASQPATPPITIARSFDFKTTVRFKRKLHWFAILFSRIVFLDQLQGQRNLALAQEGVTTYFLIYVAQN